MAAAEWATWAAWADIEPSVKIHERGWKKFLPRFLFNFNVKNA
jgi:hypothetical protein